MEDMKESKIEDGSEMLVRRRSCDSGITCSDMVLGE